MTDPRAGTAIVGAHIVDATTELVGTCLVEGGVIVDVGPDVSVPAGWSVIDGDGLSLLPGIVDSHAHLASTGPRSVAHAQLLRAGVTTAVDFSNFARVAEQFPVSTTGLTVLGLQAMPVFDEPVTLAEIRTVVEKYVDAGAIGIKVFGGHWPNTPETTAAILAVTDELAIPTAVHAGTTAHGSNLDGVVEMVELAEGRPFHLAHVNSYLRGAVTDPLSENRQLLDLLRSHREIRSEAYLADLNSCTASVRDGELTDHVVRDCLRLRGYPITVAGLEEALADGYAQAQRPTSSGLTHLVGAEAVRAWRAGEVAKVSFPVNLPVSAHVQTAARLDAAGEVMFHGPGEFVVDAISSDGGAWRNVILNRGLLHVGLGSLSLQQFVAKTALRPARMFGLTDRGMITPGARADLILVDLTTRQVRTTLVAGQSVVTDGELRPVRGEVLTSERGAAALTAQGIPHQVIDPRPLPR